jgi:hypothetical protein
MANITQINGNLINAATASFAVTASLLLGSVTSASFASTASFVNRLNQSVVITGSLTIGTSSIGSTENTLIVGLPPNTSPGEGGQILLQASGGIYTSASMIDTYQNQFRILRGTNAGSDAQHFGINLANGQATFNKYSGSGAFTATPVAGLGVDANGNIVSSTRTGRYGTAISGSTIGTGVTAQTIVYSQLIPANTLVAGDIIRTYFRFRKLATNANATYNILVNTSNAVAGATTLATLTANTVHNHMKRDFYIAQGNATTTVGAAVNIATDDTTNTQLLSVINWAVDQWIIYTVTLGTTDSGYGLGYTIEQVL